MYCYHYIGKIYIINVGITYNYEWWRPYITITDYVPDGLSELADALANPIRYQSRIEKHATQLLALTGGDDDEPAEDSSTTEQKLTADTSDFLARPGSNNSILPERSHHTMQASSYLCLVET